MRALVGEASSLATQRMIHSMDKLAVARHSDVETQRPRKSRHRNVGLLHHPPKLRLIHHLHSQLLRLLHLAARLLAREQIRRLAADAAGNLSAVRANDI